MDPARLRTLLYVDDEPHIRELVQLSIELHSDWQVETSDSGSDGLQKIARTRPDLLLLDYMMPHMDGPSMLLELRRTPGGADLPVVFLTAKTMPADVDRLLELGAASVIGKPFDPATLCEQLRRIWQAL